MADSTKKTAPDNDPIEELCDDDADSRALASDVDVQEDEDAEELFGEDAQHRQYVMRRDLRKRLDVYLFERLKGLSRNRVQKLIRLGGVHVNGKQPKASSMIRQGDVLDVILPARAVKQILPEQIPLCVAYEDDDLIVINKQADLIVHPARGNLSGTLLNALAFHFQQQRQQAHEARQMQAAAGETKSDGEIAGLSRVGADDYRPGIIHRLDRFTTGLMVVAKSDEAHWQVARQFEERKPLKCYLALVHGGPEQAAGVVDQPLGKHPTIREAHAVRHDSGGRKSVTLYRVRERYRGYSLVELELKTGRTHQIRVHLSYMGWPIVGDVIYGGEPMGETELKQPPIPAGARPMVTFARERAEGQRMEAVAAERSDMLLSRPALHASLLSFTHPILDKTLRFTAPVHEPLRTILKRLREHRVEGPVSDAGWIDLDQVLPPE